MIIQDPWCLELRRYPVSGVVAWWGGGGGMRSDYFEGLNPPWLRAQARMGQALTSGKKLLTPGRQRGILQETIQIGTI